MNNGRKNTLATQVGCFHMLDFEFAQLMSRILFKYIFSEKLLRSQTNVAEEPFLTVVLSTLWANFIELLKQIKLLKHENSLLIFHRLLAKIVMPYIACDWYLAVVYLA